MQLKMFPLCVYLANEIYHLFQTKEPRVYGLLDTRVEIKECSKYFVH